MPFGSNSTHANSPMNSPDFATSLAGLHATDKLWHASIILHTQMATRAGSLVYVRVESGSNLAGENISELTDHF